MILAIDPGPEQTAWMLYDEETNKPVEFDKADNDVVASQFTTFAYQNYRPRVAIEMVASYGKPVGKEVFETCVWIGRFIETSLQTFGAKPSLVYRADVKMNLCHCTAKVTDAVIRQALIDRFGPGKEKAIGKKKTPGPLYGISADEWAALALAVTFADKNPI